MPIYTMKAPNGKTYDIEGPEGATEEQVREEIMRRDSKAHIEKTEQGDLGRAFRIGSRNVIEGAGSLVDLVGAPANALINAATGANLSTQPGKDLGSYVSDKLSLEDAESDAERLVGKAVEYGTQGLASAGAGLALSGAKGTTGLIGKTLAETPFRDVAAGIGAGLAEEGAKQAGYGAAAQIAAGLGGGVGAYAGLSALPRNLDAAKMSVQQIKDFFSTKGYNITDEEAEAAYKYYAQGGTEDSVIQSPVQRLEGPASNQMTEQGELPLEGGSSQMEMDFAPAPVEAPQGRPRDPFTKKFLKEEQQLEMDLPEGTPAPMQREFDFNEPVANPALPVQKEMANPRHAEQQSIDDDLPTALQVEVKDQVDALTAGWDNAPKVFTSDNFDGAGEGISPTALGVYDPATGEIHLNAKAIELEAKKRNLSIPEMTNTVMFHEGLGHYGLAQKFRGELDDVLQNWYENSKWFQLQVERWIQKNPEDYIDENQTVRAAEEVLAELSETGKIPVKMMDQIKNSIKSYARQLGIPLNYSKREIEAILAQVHKGVTEGNTVEAVAGGSIRGMNNRTEESEAVRSMKSTYGESEGSVQGRAGRENKEGDASVIHKVRSNRQIDDILDNADVTKEKQNWGDWIDEADKIKMTSKMVAALAKGVEPPELKAAEKHLAKLANTIFDLTRKEANQTLSPKEQSLLAQHIRHLDEGAQAIDDVVSNAARLLNARKIEVATDDTVAGRLLRNMTPAERAMLKTQKGREAFSKKISGTKNLEKSLGIWNNLLNFTRSIWSSYDMSGPFRQGRALTHTKAFWKNIPDMFRFWGNEGFYNMAMNQIKERDTYVRMRQAGLAFTELSDDLSKREEAFQSTWAEKIPGVAASARAYNGYLNKLRADVFDAMYKNLEDAGVDLPNNHKALKDLGAFINNATGRGNLDLGKAAPTVAAVLWAPRLMASRMQMLNPNYYRKLSPGVRKEAIKSAAAFATSTGIFMSLMSQVPGVEVEADPRSSDFGKIKVGNTRYDMFGGFAQYITLYSRVLMNSRKDGKGEVKKLTDKNGKNALYTVADFLRSKFSPNMSLAVDINLGKNVVGEEIDPTVEAIKRITPMITHEIYEHAKDQGAFEDGFDIGKGLKGLAKATPSFIGIGSQVYDNQKGYDRLGRSYKEDRNNGDPIEAELSRVEEATGSSLLSAPAKSFTYEGEKIALDEEQHAEFQRVLGYYQKEYLKEDMESEEYKSATDEEKQDLIKSVRREAYADTKEYMLEYMNKGE